MLSNPTRGEDDEPREVQEKHLCRSCARLYLAQEPFIGGHGLLAYDSPYFYYIEGGSILSCREGASMLEYSYALPMAI